MKEGKMKTAYQSSLINDCPILDWIDRELVDTYQLSYDSDSKSDVLLELRHHFCAEHNQSCPNKFIGVFYKILPRLEKHYYLLGYRIRQWVALNFTLELSDPLGRVKSINKPICQTLHSLEGERKIFFEECGYDLPYHNIRAKICPLLNNTI